MLGGCVALGGVYAYYRYSGAKVVVDGARSVVGTAKEVKGKLAEVTPHSTREAISLARGAVGSCVDAIPGATAAVEHAHSRSKNLFRTPPGHGGEDGEHSCADEAGKFRKVTS